MRVHLSASLKILAALGPTGKKPIAQIEVKVLAGRPFQGLEVVTTLRVCRKVGLWWSCKELREAKKAVWINKGLTADDLALLGTLGTLGSVLPRALEWLMRSSTSSQQPAPKACSGWWRGWARAHCRP